MRSIFSELCEAGGAETGLERQQDEALRALEARATLPGTPSPGKASYDVVGRAL